MRGKLYRFPPVRKSKGADHRRERSEIGHPVSTAKGLDPWRRRRLRWLTCAEHGTLPVSTRPDHHNGDVWRAEG